MSSDRGDWQTPDCVLERVRRVGLIGLDPCTAASNPTAALYRFDYPRLDGLVLPWQAGGPGKYPSHAHSGALVYANPPYGRGIGAWVDKCREAAAAGETVIALLPARTDTRWFPWDADAICFWKGRLTFRGAPAPAPFPSAVVLWGQRKAVFLSAFGEVGKVVYPKYD